MIAVRNNLIKHDTLNHGWNAENLFAVLFMADEVKYLGDGMVQFTTEEEKKHLREVRQKLGLSYIESR